MVRAFDQVTPVGQQDSDLLAVALVALAPWHLVGVWTKLDPSADLQKMLQLYSLISMELMVKMLAL